MTLCFLVDIAVVNWGGKVGGGGGGGMVGPFLLGEYPSNLLGVSSPACSKSYIVFFSGNYEPKVTE